jgi:hypothetical protein
MTRFVKENFTFDGMYLKYDGQFIARFKHRGPVTKAKFIKTLIKNYTVEDYLAKLTSGLAPLQVLQEDGLLTFHYGENGGRNYFTLEGKVI